VFYCFGTAIDYILSKAVAKNFLSKTRSNNNKKITIMKTNLISKAVVMMVVVIASVMNFSVSASNPTQYVKNEEMTGELMTAKTIFKNEDGRLFRHLRYTYTYDNENRVISKEASKWDSVKEAWVPYFKMNVEYNNNEIAVNYARWNSKSNAYDSNIEKTVYELNDANAALMLASTK
jgi:hypothetical protein